METENLKNQIIDFLEDSNQLESLRRNGQTQSQYIGDNTEELHKQIFNFDINIDTIKLADSHPDLCDYVIQEPLEARWMFQEILLDILRELDGLSSISRCQIAVQLKVLNLPKLPQYVITNIRDFPVPYSQPPLHVFSGILISRSSIVQYTRSARFVCQRQGCVGSEESLYVRVHIPGTKESQTVHPGFQCSICESSLVEDFRRREISERVTGLMIPMGAFDVCHGQRSQSIPVLFRGEVTENLKLGGKYEVIGQPIFPGSSQLAIEQMMDCIHVIPLQNSIRRLFDMGKEIQTPNRIYGLLTNRSHSPWSFFLTLSYLFASDLLPSGIHFKLKMWMILSLTSGSSTDPRRLPLLAVGNGTLFADRLFQYGLELSEKSITFNSNMMSLCGNVRKDPIPFTDAGALLLAQGGLCYMGELSKYKKDVLGPMKVALESGNVQYEIPHYGQKCQPLESAIWSFLTITPRQVKRAKKCASGVSNKVAITEDIKPLIDVFGSALFVDNDDPQVQANIDGLMSLQILSSASKGFTPSHPPLRTEDLKWFLLQARERVVEFEVEAMTLLKKYFVASRRVRQMECSSKGSEFPQIALRTMTLMAEAHAKISLHPTVGMADATLAAYLYEESVASQYGYSYLGIEPEPNLLTDDFNYALGNVFDQKLTHFYEKLKTFVEDYAGNTSFTMGWEE